MSACLLLRPVVECNKLLQVRSIPKGSAACHDAQDTRWQRAVGGVLAKVHSRRCISEGAFAKVHRVGTWRNVVALQRVMLCTPHIKAPERCSR